MTAMLAGADDTSVPSSVAGDTAESVAGDTAGSAGSGTAGSAGGAAHDPSDGGLGRLFGRDMLYVLVWGLQLISSVLVSPVLAHLLGPSEFGRIATAIAIYQILILLAVVGFDRAISLQRAADGSDAAARVLLAYGLMIAVVTTTVAGVTAVWWSAGIGLGDARTLVLATVLWTGPGAAVQMMLALLMAADRLKPFAVVSLLSTVGGPVAGVVLLFAVHRDAGTYAFGGVITQTLAMTIGLVLVRPDFRRLKQRALFVRAVTFGLPVMLSGLSVFVLTASDRVVIQRLLGSAQVGRYQVAYTVGYVVVLALTAVGDAWTPRIAAVKDEIARRVLVGRSRDELYRLVIPTVLGIVLAAPILLRIVAPASFDPGSLLLVTLLVALSALPVTAAGASTRELLAQRRSRTLALVAGLAAAVNLGLNLLVVRHFGIEGAAASTVVAFTVQAVVQRRLVHDPRSWPRPPWSVIALLVAAVAICAGSIALPQTPLVNLIRLAAAACCLPWLLLQLRRSQRESAAGPVEPADTSGHIDSAVGALEPAALIAPAADSVQATADITAPVRAAAAAESTESVSGRHRL